MRRFVVLQHLIKYWSSRCCRTLLKVTQLLHNSFVKATVEKGAETHVYSEFTTKSNDAVTELGYEVENLDTHSFV